MPRGIRTDHYATELALLYVGTLAGLEIETFDRMTFREPPVTLTDRDRVLDDVKRFREQAAYFWFPTGPPDLFDRVQEANHRGALPGGGIVPAEKRRPELLRESDVRYYHNPLQRLITMHLGVDEMTGFAWASPWPRADALHRALD